MKRGGRAPSLTAEGVAALRAAEMVLLPPGRRVFEDPLASALLTGYRRRALRHPRLLRRLVDWNERRSPGMTCSVLVRARYARDRLEALLQEGLRQVVILGAGLDTTAWDPRLPADVAIWEVDHPATQAMKRGRLATAGIAEPRGLVFLPLDLETGDLAAGLAATGHRRAKPTLVTMLGLLPYLTRPMVQDTLTRVRGLMEGGGEVIYTYLAAAALDRGARPAGNRRLSRRMARLGEPFRFAADPDDMARLVASSGFEIVESLDGRAMTARLPEGDERVISPLVNLERARPISPRSPS